MKLFKNVLLMLILALSAGSIASAVSQIDLDDQLMSAVINSDIEAVKAHIAAGANVNAMNSLKETALMKAAEKGQTDIVKVLMAAGADVNAVGWAGKRALTFATLKGHTETVKALIAARADVNVTYNYSRQTALMTAAEEGHTDIVRALIAAGADVDAKDNGGWRALTLAALKGNPEIVKALIAAGANANPRTNEGRTALCFAEKHGNTDVANIIKDHLKNLNSKSLPPSQAESSVEQLVRIMMSNTEHQCPYTLAEKRNPNDYQDVYNLATKHPKLLKGIIYDGQTFAMLCARRGHADVLARLINEDCPVDLATPCNLCGPHEPQTTVLHKLLSEVSKMRKFKNHYSEDYIARITVLTKLIINKYPYLLDIPVNRARTARNKAIFLMQLE